MNDHERSRFSKKQRRLSSKWSLETNDKIKSNQLKNGTGNNVLELEDPSKDQLDISEGNSLKREKDIKETRQSVSGRRKRRALKRDQTLEITSSAETETDDVNKVKKVFEKDEILFLTSSNRARSRNKSRKRKNDQTNNIEIPITEILRKYEEPVPLTPLTADKIYVQGDNGFSTIKIITKEDDRKNVLKPSYVSKYETIYSPIGIAILAQKLFKRTAFIYQGLLGGMALVHLIMMQFFFNSSMDFISKYSFFSEIYNSLFSLLIILCVVSTFDKFDLAHLNVDRSKDICKDYVGSAIAIPLYLTTLCLHETYANVDDKLTLIHYHEDFNNTSAWNNTMSIEEIFDELTTWKQINMSKDFLALLGWLFVAIGIKEDALLLHLESMQGSTQTT